MLIGGNRRTDGALARGFFVEPTVFDGCSDDMSIVREEIFGPVMSVLEFDGEDEVIGRANSTEFGLSAGEFLPALIAFNVGVELGQLAVIALALLTVGLWFRERPWYRARIVIPLSLVIAVVCAYWTVERITG